ncbi:MAG: TolC family protein [Planctomycetales bacterium]|nr:TolC family protein [Planctomycetales bacterium]
MNRESLARVILGALRWGLVACSAAAAGHAAAGRASGGSVETNLPALQAAGEAPVATGDAAFRPPLPAVIDGRDIACRAAQNWLPAQTLHARARTMRQIYGQEEPGVRQAAQTLAAFLKLQAEHQEDVGAASALRAYYTRIAIAEQGLLLQESLQLLQQQEEKQQALQAGGLPAGTDLSAFQRRRIEIEEQQLQLQAQERPLRSLLAQLANVDYAMSDVRQERLEVFESSLDCPRLQQLALVRRPDLRAWQCLVSRLDESSVQLYAKTLSTLVGGWSLPLPVLGRLKSLLCPPDQSCLLAGMRQELELTVEMHRRWITQEVQEKCAKLQLAYQRINLAQETIASWDVRLAQLEQLFSLGNTQAEQLAAAQAAQLQARADEISRRLDARLAEVDLAEATGGLAHRCCDGLPWLLTGYE